ncbi:MAG TPA: hypothetical protein PLO59_01250, partial [Bacteroidia bacterium]|nr:hypothetical protein [Bacteroidia bacterium]
FDTLGYYNAAGNNYSISNLIFYLSAFEFENTTGQIYKFNDVYLVDVKNKNNLNLSFTDLPAGTYKRVTFLIGLDSLHNLSNALPNTIENNNMAWPPAMGGGYHFIKLEGKFMDQNQMFGMAIHLGRNQNCVVINITQNISLKPEMNRINLSMNINEWFKNPHIYDLNIDGNFTMSDSAAMAKIKQNGSDVFTIN